MRKIPRKLRTRKRKKGRLPHQKLEHHLQSTNRTSMPGKFYRRKLNNIHSLLKQYRSGPLLSMQGCVHRRSQVPCTTAQS